MDLVVPEGFRRCSKTFQATRRPKYQCRNVFPTTDVVPKGGGGRTWQPAKRCQKCRATAKRQKQLPSANASVARQKESGSMSKRSKRYRNSETGRAAVKAYTSTEAYRKKQRLRPRRMIKRLSDKVGKMLSDGPFESKSVFTYTAFGSNAEARAHFASTFEPWMHWGNYGRHIANAPYKYRWNIGHRIPRAFYDDSNVDDIRRSLLPDNLYAQCARSNNETSHRVAPSKRLLLSIVHVWPTRCADIDELLALFSVHVPDSSSDSDSSSDWFD